MSSISDLIARSPMLSCLIFAFALTVLANACDHFFAPKRARVIPQRLSNRLDGGRA